ncbi:MAG TPA: RNA polymerase sigma factor, partial [Kofleriaceae bacterium]|nr:RNA polymerase sigma factor [Kofleriaceae bacterium]
MERVASDAELLLACRRGEQAAFGRLIERYQDLVGAVSYGATGDRALSEDVAQDTFLCAWRRLDQVREPAQVRAWLCGIARNLGRKALRRRRREVPDLERPELEADGAPSPLDVTLEAESERIVRAALERIPARYREALILYYQQGRSIREVAGTLGIGEDAAMQR